jgi:murein DD-endopeptidase MepM/ murein hydrolase activator NlpD
VFADHRARAVKLACTTLFLAASLVPFMSNGAAGEEKLSDLKARMDSIQADLDASTAKVEAAHAREEELKSRMRAITNEMEDIEKRNEKLTGRAVERAVALYKTGGTEMVEVLFGSEGFTEMTDRAQLLSDVSLQDSDVFVELARDAQRLEELSAEMTEKRAELAEVQAEMKRESDKLLAQFDSVSDDYEALRKKLAPAAPTTTSASPAASASLKGTGGMFCPVAGPTSFVDSWGAPRSGGRSHQGVDMMAAHGTPQVAIVSGTITYAAYDSLGGNIQYLSGDDGNLYIYIHQRENVVTGGHVSAGQVISYVGDTGNAAGSPHLHFEYHPGGGAAVNPTPLVSSLC